MNNLEIKNIKSNSKSFKSIKTKINNEIENGKEIYLIKKEIFDYTNFNNLSKNLSIFETYKNEDNNILNNIKNYSVESGWVLLSLTILFIKSFK